MPKIAILNVSSHAASFRFLARLSLPRAVVAVSNRKTLRTIFFRRERFLGLLLYRSEFSTLAQAHKHFIYCPTLSHPNPDWIGGPGCLDAKRIIATHSRAENTDFYLCAGNEMMAMLRQGLLDLGITTQKIHSEAFGVGAASGQSGLRVTVNQSGRAKTLLTAGEPTLLTALEANEVRLTSEYRAGSYGQCVATLLVGEVDWLLKPEFSVYLNQFLPCLCTAKSDLSLALVT